jgi:hypothetical protein
MKKLVMLFAGILLMSGPIYAQDESSDEGSSGGVGSGDVLIELTGTPFDTNNGFLNFTEFRGRYFLNDNMAVRLGVWMDLNNTTTTPDVVINDSEYRIMPGFEYHLTNEGAFRTYAAADVVLRNRILSRKSTSGPTVLGSTNVPTSNNQNLNKGYFDVGLRLGAGAEYHFGSRFYFGVEVGFELINRTNSEVNVDGDLYQAKTTSNFANVNVANSFRFGFKLL